MSGDLSALIATLGTVGTVNRDLAGDSNESPDPGLMACTTCREPLDGVHADLGTHPGCDPNPAALEPPPPTLAGLRVALIDWESNSPRSLQKAPGPSEIAVRCDRRLGYRIAGVPSKPDDRVKWAPLIGTAVHDLNAQALARHNQVLGYERWLIEQRVHPDPMLSGSCDAYDTDTDIVIDWKVVGPTRLDHYRRHGPGAQYAGQVQIYGRGWQRAGRNPKWVRIVFLPRTTDFYDAYEWTAPYDRAMADGLLDRFYAISTLLSTLGVADNPALWAAVPATPDPDCRFCPWFRRGGPADGIGCPGDPDADQRRINQFTAGLIAPQHAER